MKSEIVVPAMLVDRITPQYSVGWYSFARSCTASVTAKKPIRISELAA